MTFDEYESRGLCECGTPLDEHPELPKPPPLKSWMATRNVDQETSEKASATVNLAFVRKAAAA